MSAPSDIRRRTRPFRDIGRRLDAVREALGFQTKRAFAEYLGVKQPTYSLWSTGADRPEVLYMMKLMERNGVSLDYIYQGVDYNMPAGLMRQIEAVLQTSAKP